MTDGFLRSDGGGGRWRRNTPPTGTEDRNTHRAELEITSNHQTNWYILSVAGLSSQPATLTRNKQSFMGLTFILKVINHIELVKRFKHGVYFGI